LAEAFRICQIEHDVTIAYDIAVPLLGYEDSVETSTGVKDHLLDA
jgi:hypothetical protein